ncbi:MAG: ribose-5-phosphate isomerase RpiA [Phycisphaerales bacterium]|nr:ribose-5-phosphate isomerase RpiA [Phycisphaerales bacterium]
MTQDPRQTDLLAQAAVESIRTGMIVGLGTGRAASRGIHALAERVKRESLDITCVATSRRSAELALSLGLSVVPMRDVARVDVLFDGIDELEPGLAMTKGAGGAMTREKIVADAADLCIYLMDDSKLVQRLGERFALPVEVLEFGLAATSAGLERIGLGPLLRTVGDETQDLYLTDEGNLVLDCAYGETSAGDLLQLSRDIDSIPGVVGHGLFVTQADVVLIESADRQRLERRERP